MPAGLAAGFAARLRDVQASVGTGVTASPADAMAGIHLALANASLAAGRAWQATPWTGEAGAAAAEFTHSTVASVETLADQAKDIGAAAGHADAAVARARARLQAIIDDFESRAAVLEGRLDEPGVAEQLIDEGNRALAGANAVVDELRTELDSHTATVNAPPTNPAAGLPQLPGLGALSGLGSALGGGAAGLPSGGLGAGFGQATLDAAPRPGDSSSVDSSEFGSGVAVQLPDGSTAKAPNAVAASAVRHALTQLGVPYRWGGEAPGVGMDCSGLTQWAYHEAGLDLPRLAQEQDIGKAVAPGSLRPGDLAVWDGHVAMIVGDGTMIEAGDPVHLSPIRTTNAGQGFQGFWRPTA